MGIGETCGTGAEEREGLREELFDDYVTHLAGRLRPIAEGDSVKQFCDLCCAWPQYLSARGLILPEIIVSLVSHNALRCTRAVLQRTAPQLRGYEVDLNVRHLYGFAPLHVAAEAFNVNMVQLLLRHGASANIHTKGSKVIEGLLPLHVAVQNAAMHKYLEDHWADGDPVENLIFLLCLPEMKMFLDTTRLIAKHTDNIADEIWNYIDSKKLVPASILLLAAQKQLRDRDRVSGSKVSLTRFCSVKSRINAAALALHREALAMVKEGKNGRPLKQVKHKKGLLDTANAILDIVLQAGEALERFIQTNSSEVPHEEIVEHVSSILKTMALFLMGKALTLEISIAINILGKYQSTSLILKEGQRVKLASHHL
ncbi:hypothetical protein QOZ80_1AG0042030 [Eleusine coracana subsp. coracana]|nr:hypothetical protein QOZ80_1AG0042030 [Eleusine coracana subsp. coracana]